MLVVSFVLMMLTPLFISGAIAYGVYRLFVYLAKKKQNNHYKEVSGWQVY